MQPGEMTGKKPIYGCPICKSKWSHAAAVRNHYAQCAEFYGNPKGKSWDDDDAFVPCA